MLNNKTVLRVISLVAAILLWAYVMVEVDPEKSARVEVSVSFANEEALADKGLAAVVSDDMTVAASVKGRRSRINSIKKTGLTAYVDVSSCKKGENQGEIIINDADGVTIEGLSEEYLQFEVEDLAEEEKPLEVKFTKGTIKADQKEDPDKVPWVTAKDPEEVVVTGAQSAVDKVVCVEATVSAQNLSEDESKWVRLSVTAVDKRGDKVPGVTVSDSEYIRAQIMLLSQKSVEVEVSAENIEGDMELDQVEGVDRIKIVGPAYVLENIDKITGTVDMTGITGTDFNETKMNLVLPEGIYLYKDENPLTVEVKLKAVQ